MLEKVVFSNRRICEERTCREDAALHLLSAPALEGRTLQANSACHVFHRHGARRRLWLRPRTADVGPGDLAVAHAAQEAFTVGLQLAPRVRSISIQWQGWGHRPLCERRRCGLIRTCDAGVNAKVSVDLAERL